MLTQGRGTLYGADGSRFTGAFAKGQRHGRGQQTERDGSSFAGMFEAGKKSGPGVQTSARGDVFRGNYVRGARQGLGSYAYSNGARLDAVYEADVPRHAAAERDCKAEPAALLCCKANPKSGTAGRCSSSCADGHLQQLTTYAPSVQVWAVRWTRWRWERGCAAPHAGGGRGSPEPACHARSDGMRIACARLSALAQEELEVLHGNTFQLLAGRSLPSAPRLNGTSTRPGTPHATA